MFCIKKFKCFALKSSNVLHKKAQKFVINFIIILAFYHNTKNKTFFPSLASQTDKKNVYSVKA